MAKPASGKQETPTIDKAVTKKMFAKAKKKPINVGVCKASDGSILLLMHKSKRGPALKAELEKEFGKDEVDTPRWGTAYIDKKADAKLVILDMNKPLAGAARKLKKALKGTGITKIRYMVEGSVSEEMVTIEPGDENEPEVPDDDEDDEDETEDQNETVTASNDEGAGQTRNPEVLSDNDPAPAQPVAQDAAPPPAPPEQPAAPAFDVNALNRRLMDLVKRMMPIVQGDPSRQAELAGLAKAAQAAVKNDPQTAEAAINALEQALGGGGAAQPATAQPATAQTPPPAPPAPPVDPAKQAALAASPKIWNDTISVVTTGVSALKDAIRKDFADEAPEVMADIEKNLARIDQVTARFDKQLADLLDGVNAATDEAARKAGLAKARTVLAEHIKYAASEPLIGMIDQNPFGVSPDIKKTLVANLTQLANAIR